MTRMKAVSPSVARRTISKSLADNKLSFMLGAGISMVRQSHLPQWSVLVSGMVNALRGQTSLSSSIFKSQGDEKLLNEAVLRIFERELGQDSTVDGLRHCIETDAFSAIHAFLASAAHHFDAHLLTTNYDHLIERGAQTLEFPSPPVLRLHGTLNDPSSMRFSERSVFEPLSKDLRSKVAQAVKGRHLLVIGYRGADEFDVMPALFDKMSLPSRVTWIYRSDPPDEHVEKWLSRVVKIESVQSTDVDGFLAGVWQAAASDDVNGTTLSNLFPSADPPNRVNWWHEGLRQWGVDLLESKGDSAKLIWPRILEHVAPSTKDEAPAIIQEYNAFLEAHPDSIEARFAQAQILKWRWVEKSVVEDEFREAISQVEGRISNSAGDSAQQLQSHLGMMLHVYGRFLFESRKYPASETTLMRAYKERKDAKDLQAAYSMFQVFMHARARVKKGECRKLPELPFTFEKLSRECWDAWKRYKKQGEIGHAATMMHNAAMIIEEEIDLAVVEGMPLDATTISEMHDLYVEAYDVRLRLRAPQQYHRSYMRVAHSKALLATLHPGISKQQRGELLGAARAYFDELEREGDKVAKGIRDELADYWVRWQPSFDSLPR